MKSWMWVGVLAGLCAAGGWAQDPPSRIARLNYSDGNVSMQPAGVNEWVPADTNRPFTSGDSVYSDSGSRAEFHLDTAVIRAGEATSFGFVTLNDQTVQLRLTQGDLYVTLRELDASQVFEVDSPNAAVSLLRSGVYRFRVTSNGGLTFVVVRQGQAEITGDGQAFNLTPGKSAAISGSGGLSYNLEEAPPPDEFDAWSEDRDQREARRAAERNLPPEVIGAEDMEQYGAWQNNGSYGQVWYPTTVPVGWAPYRYGRWAWIEPWGWTWVDDAPWGFAPFHYGRWAYIDRRWGWCPGPLVEGGHRHLAVRPVYSPALVVWFGGGHSGVSIEAGGGPRVGWVPLGYGEVYTPAYHCSPRYFNNVNVSNTTVVKTVNITNVYNNVYVNKTVYNQRYVNAQAPNGMTAMPQGGFASGQRVGQQGGAMGAAQLRRIQPQAAVMLAPAVMPTHQALIASNVSRAIVARPSMQVQERKVVMRNSAALPAAFRQGPQPVAGMNAPGAGQSVQPGAKPSNAAVSGSAPFQAGGRSQVQAPQPGATERTQRPVTGSGADRRDLEGRGYGVGPGRTEPVVAPVAVPVVRPAQPPRPTPEYRGNPETRPGPVAPVVAPVQPRPAPDMRRAPEYRANPETRPAPVAPVVAPVQPRPAPAAPRDPSPTRPAPEVRRPAEPARPSPATPVREQRSPAPEPRKQDHPGNAQK